MAGIIRLSNTGTGNGQSTITTAASGDTTYTLPSGGGTFVTTASTQALTVPFASGTVSAPSVAFLGDSNTGIYSPVADTIAFTEGGVESLRIDSSGRVGIGTTSPGGKLVVSDGSTTFQFDPVGGTGNILRSLTSAGARDSLLLDASQLVYSNGGSERFRCDTSGRLLVGTSSSTGNIREGQLFSVTAQNSGYGGMSLGCYNSGSVAPILDFNTSASSSSGNYAAVANNRPLGYIVFRGSDGSQFVESATIKAEVDGTPGANDMPGRLVFSVTQDGQASPTERLRIKSNGETWSNYSFVISKGSSFANYGGYFAYDAGADRLVIVNNSAGASSGVALAPGATSWSTYSDERLKTDLVPIDDGLGKVSLLRAVTGRYNTDLEGTSRSFLIAQDVQAVLPEAVSAAGEDAFLDLRYTEVIPLLVAALKESKERIETLEAKVAALESA
jgi:hypothetical protein